MVNIRANGNQIAYGIKHFVLDNVVDLGTIDRSILTPGSTAFIIATSEYYMLNGLKNWIEINPFSVSGDIPGGGGGSDNDEYDGGSIDGTGTI